MSVLASSLAQWELISRSELVLLGALHLLCLKFRIFSFGLKEMCLVHMTPSCKLTQVGRFGGSTSKLHQEDNANDVTKALDFSGNHCWMSFHCRQS